MDTTRTGNEYTCLFQLQQSLANAEQNIKPEWNRVHSSIEWSDLRYGEHSPQKSRGSVVWQHHDSWSA